jgi:hypothetical protein
MTAFASESDLCAFCEVPVSSHPDPLCSPGTVRDLRSELAEVLSQRNHALKTHLETIRERDYLSHETNRMRVELAKVEAERDELTRQQKHLKASLDLWQHTYQTIADQLWESCICNRGPDTNGPEEDCPVHGTEEHRPLALKATVDRVRAAVMNQSSTVSLTEAVLAALDAPGGGKQ